jgi:lipid-binding SYLF domain-containing protein
VRDPIVGFVFDVKGLMADVSLKGAKITKLDKPK